jgi:hypothetical protein
MKRSRADRARDEIAESASTLSEQLRGRVAPVALKARDAKVWMAPRVERGVERGLEAAAPRVELAVERVSPKVDAARDKLVEDLLPRLVDALNAAAAAGHSAAEAGEEVRHRTKGAAAVLKGDAVAKPAKHRRRRFLVFTMLVAGIGAAVAAFKSRSSKDDPWAIPSTTYSSPGAAGAPSPGPTTSSASSTGPTTSTASTPPTGTGAHQADVDLRDSATGAGTGMTSASEAGKDAVEDAATLQGDELTDTTGGGKAKKKP